MRLGVLCALALLAGCETERGRLKKNCAYVGTTQGTESEQPCQVQKCGMKYGYDAMVGKFRHHHTCWRVPGRCLIRTPDKECYTCDGGYYCVDVGGWRKEL